MRIGASRSPAPLSLPARSIRPRVALCGGEGEEADPQQLEAPAARQLARHREEREDAEREISRLVDVAGHWPERGLDDGAARRHEHRRRPREEPRQDEGARDAVDQQGHHDDRRPVQSEHPFQIAPEGAAKDRPGHQQAGQGNVEQQIDAAADDRRRAEGERGEEGTVVGARTIWPSARRRAPTRTAIGATLIPLCRSLPLTCRPRRERHLFILWIVRAAERPRRPPHRHAGRAQGGCGRCVGGR